ncbi:MAG: phosphoglucosamine mutase [Isosphaeraceae bacterium]
MNGSGTRIASVSGLRGIVGDGFDPAVAVEFAAAYANECEPGPIVVSHDGRVSAAVFTAAVQAGIAATGHDVLLAGATATPTVGFLVRELGCAGGIQISASHNPPEYNGLKFFQRGGMVLSQAQGQALLDRWQRRDFRWESWDGLGTTRTIDEPDASHLARVLEQVDCAAIERRNLKVALDACHGAGGRLGAALLRALGCQTVILGGQPDGRYDHPPEPTLANLGEFARVVRAVDAAVGFAQDPDADRLAIVDETGQYIGEELTLALAASRRLEQQRGPVVLNLSTSRVTEDIAARLGCPVFRAPVGEINVVERMIAENSVLGGEGNGGVIDPRVGYVRDSFVAMALVLDLLAATGLTLSRLVAGLPRYSMVKHKFPLAESAGDSQSQRQAGDNGRRLWQRISGRYPEARADFSDGLRLDWDDRWAHVRASNTEPIMRVISEAPNLQAAEELAREVGSCVAGPKPKSAP